MIPPKMLIAGLLITGSWAVAANAECPRLPPGAPYPWQTGEIMPGDQWAWVYIDVDKKGRPIRCRIGESNIDEDMRFWVCKAFTDDWRTEPLTKEGVPVESTVKRKFLAYGDKHRKLQEEARKRFFQENPNERPKCYPG